MRRHNARRRYLAGNGSGARNCIKIRPLYEQADLRPCIDAVGAAS